MLMATPFLPKRPPRPILQEEEEPSIANTVKDGGVSGGGARRRSAGPVLVKAAFS